MRRRDFNPVCVVVGILVMSPLLWAQADANAPWDPNAHLVAYPRICQLSTDYLFAEYGEPVWSSVDRKIGLLARVTVPDPNGLIGLSQYPTDVVAWDEFGTVLDPATIRSGSPTYVPLTYAATVHLPEMTVTVEPLPYDVSLDLRVGDPQGSFPVSLSRVEWSMSVLLSDQFETVDLPFAPTDDWIEIAPGLEVLIEEATVANGRYDYRMQTRLDPDEIVHMDDPTSRARRDDGYGWSSQPLPAFMVTAVEVLDADGTVVQYQYQGGDGGATGMDLSVNKVDGLIVITRHETGSCDACGQAAFLRHTIAYAPYEQEVRLVMEDVTLPVQ